MQREREREILLQIGKTGVTADRDKIEFRLFNSSSILGKLESRPTVTRLSLVCLILVRSLI